MYHMIKVIWIWNKNPMIRIIKIKQLLKSSLGFYSSVMRTEKKDLYASSRLNSKRNSSIRSVNTRKFIHLSDIYGIISLLSSKTKNF